MKTEPVRSHHRASRTAVRVALLVIGVALLAAIVVAVARPSWIANALKGRIEEVATKSMGRPVTIGSIDANFFPTPGASITNLRMEGAEGEPPFVEAQSASATVQLWPLIRSLGREVRVGAVKLDKATLNLVRREDGTWNYEDLKSSEESSSDREVWIDRVVLDESELRVVDHQAKGGTAAVALEQIHLELSDIGPNQTMSMEGAAALASREQNLTAELDIESPLGKPEDFFPAIVGVIEMKGVGVSAFKKFLPPDSAALFTGGVANGRIELSTTERKHYAVAGDVQVHALRLRGEPANGGFHFKSTIDPAKAEAAVIHFDQASMKGPGVDLGGTATVSLQPMAVEFAVKGPLLDLAQLMSALPEDADAEAEQKELVPAELRSKLGTFTVRGSMEIDQVRRGKLVANAVKAQGNLTEGVFRLESGSAQVYGGEADLSGTRIDLNPAQPEWSLRAKVKGMDVAQAFSSVSGHQALAGKAHVDLTLDGEGADWETIRKDMSGDGVLQMLDGALSSADLGEKIAPAIAAGLRKVGKEGVAGTVENAGQGTELNDLRTAFTVRDGFITLTRPIQFKSEVGEFQLGGRIALDQRLDLDGKVTASPQFVSRVTRGMISSSLPVPLAIDGTLKAPDVKPGSPGSLVKNLARNPPAPVKREIDRAKETAKEKAKEGIGDALNRLRNRP